MKSLPGDDLGTHRVLSPRGALPQPAEVLDAGGETVYESEIVVDVETLNIDAASFRQMEEAVAMGNPAGVPQTPPVAMGNPAGVPQTPVAMGNPAGVPQTPPAGSAEGVGRLVLETVRRRGKQHNPVTGSGGMLLGTVRTVGERVRGRGFVPGDRVATLASLSLTPLSLTAIRAVRPASAQVDVEGTAYVFASAPLARMPADMPERLALAVLDVAGAAPQVARLCHPGETVVVLGAGGKSGLLCTAEARRRVGASGRVVGLEAHPGFAADLSALGLCDHVAVVDARDPVAVRDAVLPATGGRGADLTLSCVNVSGVELSAIVATRDRGKVYYFAMSTSFTAAALGAEGIGRDVDLYIGNGYARGHADHTLELVRSQKALAALLTSRYG